uniref:hypothetical protein n=1 Tax=Chlorococcum tatrense TaxID=915274 RepID=UPI0010C4BDE9|nr:hypothetical protein [Chlorococcum tatrense]AYQ94301.1 hypothetical protein [Chlorococcum tatrense]
MIHQLGVILLDQNKIPIKKLADKRHNGIIICEICDLTNWLKIPLINFAQKDYVNGNFKDNALNNFRTVCPNCHAQTTTRFKIKDSHVSRLETCLSKKNVILGAKLSPLGCEARKNLWGCWGCSFRAAKKNLWFPLFSLQVSKEEKT